MKKKLIIVLVGIILLIVELLMYFKPIDITKVFNKSEKENEETETSTAQAEIKTIVKTISKTGEITSNTEEKIGLYLSYYLSEIYFEQNQYINAGENILKYTNGTYLEAPYNCVITEMNVPEINGICTSKDSITIKGTDTLLSTLTVDEDDLEEVSVGQEAEITIPALNNKTYSGYVTNVSNTAIYSSNGSKFEVTVEFGNDGEVMIGMTGNTQVILNKVENVVVVPTEAVETNNGISTVIVVKDDETSETRTVEIGLSNNAYTEIKTGISEGETIKINKDLTSTNTKTSGNNGQLRENEMNFGRNQSSKNTR